MSARLKDDKIKRKLEEADKAMGCVIMRLSKIGESERKKIALFIEEVKGDGKDDTGSVQ